MRNNKRSYNKNKKIFKNKTINNKNKKHKKIKLKGGQHSFAQLKQDIKVLEFYKNKRDGYYVDIGANDGIELSNTYLLEKDYGWKGICVEPLPEQFQELLKNRKSINVNKAVYNTTGEILDFTSSDFLSGVTKNINTHKHVILTKPKIKVETITLNDILDQNNAPNFIDYLTLDTEGSELIILKALNFDKYKFGLIHLEHNHQEPRRSDIKNLLLSKGYKYLGENESDDEYAYEQQIKTHNIISGGRLYKGGANEKIPKIIHQIWIGYKKRPDIWMDTVKSFCNEFGYEYKLWDETNISRINLINKKYYDAKESYDGKCDILRYEILYNYGGIYIDADMVIINGSKLNTIIEEFSNDIGFAWEPSKYHKLIANSVIFSVKNSKFMKDCVDGIKDRNLSDDAWRATGPQYITDMYNTKKYDDIKLYDSVLFYPVDWHGTTKINSHKNANYPDSVMYQYGYTTTNLERLI